MNGDDLLLDTNAVIAWANNDATLCALVNRARAVSVPVIVWGELVYGSLNSARPDENTRRIRTVIAEFSILAATQETAEHYASIRLSLKRIGRPIPENDIWIAAIARQLGLSLVSRDAHFSSVSGISVVDW